MMSEVLVIAAPALSIQSLPRSAFIRGAGMTKAAIQKVLLLVLIVICGCFSVVAFDFYPVHPFITG